MASISIVTMTFSSGGAERVAVNLANAYAGGGHDVTLVATKDATTTQTSIDAGVAVIDASGDNVAERIRNLRRHVLDVRPDCVLSVLRSTNVLLGMSLASIPREQRPRVIFREANTLHWVYKKPLLERLVKLGMMRWTYAFADRVIANSEEVRNDLRRAGVTAREGISVVPNPVLPENYRELLDAPLEHPWLGDPSLRVVLSVGRLHEQKNYPMLFEAFAKAARFHPELRLVILGEGPLRERLGEICVEQGIGDRVEFLPYVSNPYPYYRQSSVFALTSSWEGFGNVLVEALAAGTPVVATRCSGGPATILGGGEYGTLVPVGDADRFAEALLATLERGQQKNPKNVQRALEYSVANISRLYEAILFKRELA